MSWLPMMTTSGARAAAPISVTLVIVSASRALASASISIKPSACENAVTEPEPFGEGKAIIEFFTLDQCDQHEFLAAKLGRHPHRHSRFHYDVDFPAAGRRACRITGATKVWKVKIAEVGKPGSTTTGF